MLVPPDNFGLVEPGVYRCLKLEADHMPFLATLQLKSIVLLDAAKPPRNLKAYLEENEVRLFRLGGLKFSSHGNFNKENEKPGSSQLSVSHGDIEVIDLDRGSNSENNKETNSWMLIEPGLIESALEIMLNKTRHNVVFVDLSLTLVGILRRIQKWNFSSIVNEYRIYTGNSSKNNYNAENFLELIEIEMIPYEVDQWLRSKREKGLEFEGRTLSISSAGSQRRLKPSLDEGNLTNDDDNTSVDDYEDDMDDDLLLASPQIPANLLKLVEQRKQDDQGSAPQTPPEHRISSLLLEKGLPTSANSRHNSISGDGINLAAHRRKLSMDARFTRPANIRFRKPSFSELQRSPGRKPSFETSLRHYRIERERSGGIEELALTKEIYGFQYYKPRATALSSFVEPIKIHLPPEHKLPDWFIQGRDFWESLYKNLNPES